MKRTLPLLLALVMVFVGCAPKTPKQPEQKQYTATFLTLFDTVTTVLGFASSEEEFQQKAQEIHDRLEHYHQLFDIFNEYDGVANLKTVNDHAGIAPVQVEEDLISMLEDCVEYCHLTGGKVNVAMGQVLAIWHEARSDGIRDPMNASLPDMERLQAAFLHADLSCLEMNREDSTVYLTDSEMTLDVGAIAKGWAAQRVAEEAPEGMLISVGGNVCATGPKDSDGTPWVVGIQNPDGGDNLHTLYVTGGAVVTSGDYQRTYTVDGKKYHHIIDPQTLMPAAHWRSVTVVCADSAMADALSTALFLLPYGEGKTLAAQCGVQVLWVAHDGGEFMTPGLQEMIRT